MKDQGRASAGRPPGEQVEPGDRAPADRRRPADPDSPAEQRRPRLERAPGERYASGTTGETVDVSSTSGPGLSATLAAVTGATVGGALLIGVLGSFDLGLGMLVVAAFVGWVVALAVVWAMPVRRVDHSWLRPTVAALLAGGSMVAGLLLLWAWALVEGGVLGPVAYADARFGLLAPLLALVAAVVGAVRAR